jgi:hypothetical protein
MAVPPGPKRLRSKDLSYRRKLFFKGGAETAFEFGADAGDFHAGHDHKFAGDHFTRLVVVGQFAFDAAILAILIPAEAAVRDRFRADELKAA